MIDIKMTVSYKGREYKDFEKAIFDATVDGIKKVMADKMRPFKSDIEKEGGHIILNITGDSISTLGGQLEVKNISTDLKNRINAVLK